MDQLSDEQLLSAVLAGEMDALAQDLAQETFLRVLRQHTCRGDQPFKPWLYAIATNLEDAYLLVTGTQPVTA